MPERPQPNPQEYAPASKPKLRKVYDRDVSEREERLRQAKRGIEKLKVPVKNKTAGEIAADRARVKAAVGGLRESLALRKKPEVDLDLADTEDALNRMESVGSVGDTAGEEAWFQAGERGEAGDIVKPEQTEAVEGATMNAAQKLNAIENQIEGKFGIDLSALKINKGAIKKARVEDPALFAMYDDAKAEYDAWLEQGKQAGAFTGRTTAGQRLNIGEIAAGERSAMTVRAKVDMAKTKPEEEIELEIDDADIDDSDDDEEVLPAAKPVERAGGKPAFTPKEQEWFAEGEKGNAGDVSMSSREKDETVVKALQDAAARLNDTTQDIKVRLKDVNFNFEAKGWWGKRHLRKAREKYPDLFKRYDDEKREYDALLVQADRYGVFSGKVGTPRLGMMEKAKQRLATEKVLGKE